MEGYNKAGYALPPPSCSIRVACVYVAFLPIERQWRGLHQDSREECDSMNGFREDSDLVLVT